MSRFARTLLGVALAALTLTAGASSVSPAGYVPTLLRPTANQSIAVGTPIVFQIQTYAGDDLNSLYLNVSRSPAVVDPCGTIGNEVDDEWFTATANPSVYQAAPSYYSDLSNWMNQPGTYYWQAYRSDYSDDADGCIESEVRSFTITGTPAPLIPPTLLSPAPGKSFRVGTKLTFQIRTHADDADIFLLVSHSKKRSACGIINDDVDNISLSASSDPAVYVAKPTYYKGGWMDRPGTYYWQAYRVEFGGGADGCIESEVRSFKLKSPPPKSLAAARLEGSYKIKFTVRSTSIRVIKRGTYKEEWDFDPNCARGACSTVVSAYSGESVTDSGWSLRLKRRGTLYRNTKRDTLLACTGWAYWTVTGPLSISVRVTKAAWVGTVWRATRMTGTFRYSVGSTSSGNIYCPGGAFSATLRGTLSVQSSDF